MSPYIYSEKNGIHIINLYKTLQKLEESCSALEKIASSGRKILFVATKKQAKDIVAKMCRRSQNALHYRALARRYVDKLCNH